MEDEGEDEAGDPQEPTAWTRYPVEIEVAALAAVSTIRPETLHRPLHGRLVTAPLDELGAALAGGPGKGYDYRSLRGVAAPPGHRFAHRCRRRTE